MAGRHPEVQVLLPIPCVLETPQQHGGLSAAEAHPRREDLVFQMAEVAVPRELFRGILDRIAGLRPPVVARC